MLVLSRKKGEQVVIGTGDLAIRVEVVEIAGFELGTGFFINPTPPEDAARFLRQAGRAADGMPA